MKSYRYFVWLLNVLFVALLINSCDKGNGDMDPVVDLDSGLVYYFPFSGNSIDQVSNETYDIKEATFGADRFNVPNKALKMVNNGLYGQGMDIGAGLGEAEGSLSFWINLDDLEKLHPLFIKAYFHNFSAREYNMFINSDSTMTLYWTNEDIWPTTPKVIKCQQWQHIVVRWSKNKSVLEVLVDGNVVLTNNYQSDRILDPQEPPQKMGYSYNYEGSHTGSSNYFRGRIDEIRRYNRWLRDAEVDALIDHNQT